MVRRGWHSSGCILLGLLCSCGVPLPDAASGRDRPDHRLPAGVTLVFNAVDCSLRRQDVAALDSVTREVGLPLQARVLMGVLNGDELPALLRDLGITFPVVVDSGRAFDALFRTLDSTEPLVIIRERSQRLTITAGAGALGRAISLLHVRTGAATP